MTLDVADWLHRLGLEQYAPAFRDNAIDAAANTGERWYEPELLRLKAEMLLALPTQRATEAELHLKAAISLARQHLKEAKALLDALSR